MFSQYVVELLNVLVASENQEKYHIVSLINDAKQHAEAQIDIEVLDILSGSLSMSYNKNKFCPMFVLDNGKRSFSMEDIDDTAISILNDVLTIISHGWMCAQIAHILWIINHDSEKGKLAVSEYILQFELRCDVFNWVKCFRSIECAFEIAKEMGRKSECFTQTITTINYTLDKINGNDPLFLSSNLISMIYEFADKDALRHYLEIVKKIIEGHISRLNSKIQVVETAFALQEKLLRKLKQDSTIREEKIRLATYYEALAMAIKNGGTGSKYLAISCLRKACGLYGKDVEREKKLRLRKQIDEIQNEFFGNIIPVCSEYDVSKIYSMINEMFIGLSIPEAIIQMSRLAKIYQVDEVKQAVLRENKEFLSKSLFGIGKVDRNNRIVDLIVPLDLKNPEADEELLFRHMVEYVNRRRNLGESIGLKYAYKLFSDKGFIDINDLKFITNGNPLIPQNRTKIIETGLYMGLSGDLYAAMHILLPQTENIFRNLVEMCGDTITFMKEDGVEEYKPLSQLFRSDKLLECYDNDIIFTFQSIMDEKTGANLRNLNAHGLLEPEVEQTGIMLCYLCLLIRLLSMYTADAIEIINRLAEQ